MHRLYLALSCLSITTVRSATAAAVRCQGSFIATFGTPEGATYRDRLAVHTIPCRSDDVQAVLSGRINRHYQLRKPLCQPLPHGLPKMPPTTPPIMPPLPHPPLHQPPSSLPLPSPTV